jgi:hypothetical protein
MHFSVTSTEHVGTGILTPLPLFQHIGICTATAKEILVIRHAQNSERIDVGVTAESKWSSLRTYNHATVVAALTVIQLAVICFPAF